jgi:hypothetical protein
MSYQCEVKSCPRPATTEWTFTDDIEQRVDTTYRCNEHPELDDRYDATPLMTKPVNFYESLFPANAVVDQSAGLSNCCGWVISNEGHCLDCGEEAR